MMLSLVTERIGRGLPIAAQLMDQGQAAGRDEDNIGRPGRAVAEAVLAGPVQVDGVVRVLDGGDAEAASDQHRQHGFHQHRLAAAAPADDAENLHAAPSTAARRSASARSSGALTLKNGSNGAVAKSAVARL